MQLTCFLPPVVIYFAANGENKQKREKMRRKKKERDSDMEKREMKVFHLQISSNLMEVEIRFSNRGKSHYLSQGSGEGGNL